MKNFLVLVTFVAFTSFGQSQDFKFGKVSKEELQEKVHPLDSSANAAILYRSEDVSFNYMPGNGFTQQRLIHERVKIYNASGKDYGTRRLSLYSGSSGRVEKLIGLKGVTYNLVNDKIIKDKLRKDGIFKEEANHFYNYESFSMPNVQEGSIIEYTYKITSPFLEIDDINLQKDIPIKKLKARIATPQYFEYNKYSNIRAFFSPSLIDSKKRRTYTVNSRDREFNSTNSNVSSSTREYEDNIITIDETDVPALKEEAYVGNVNNYRAKLSMEIAASLDFYGVIQESYATSWEKVSKSIYKSSGFGNQINRSGFFKDEVSDVLSGIDNPFQKAFVLQSFVKSKVKWNGYYGYRALKGTKKAYELGEGNVADINLLLIAMLKSQGVNANPVLISTRNNGIPLFPTRKGFNYVVCMVEHDDSFMLLDASDLYSMPNVLPERALNWNGRLVKENGLSKWVSLRPEEQSIESTSLNVKINDDATISGKVRKNITSHDAMSYRKKYAKISNEGHIKAIEFGKGDIEVSDVNFENEIDLSKPLKVFYSYECFDAVDDIASKLYFSPLFFMAQKENPFKSNSRNFPIDFVYPKQNKTVVNILIPDGYKVESIPKSEIIDFKDGAVKYTFISKESGKYLQFSINLDIKKSLIAANDYIFFKEFYGKIIEKQAEQIVLSKQ